ncbi:glycosyltransferase family 2 protein [Maribacter sp. MMG018]|uniref:glycosyltransferase n=1 Tax=Maribacter sp. MMG018 TaxID=2822688 RepID=UPI001B39C201|nr:glycosyltransferase family 2 protein [Maribacter sp. MMG018]MBQ4915639.1 glycosyltransferase family 2 protein [Maribacter sp. MMG018]
MFSILTPTYNRAKELPRVYDSLIGQTFRDFEWVIADDGSTDETAALIKEWQKKELDFKITYHVLAKNKGKSYAVNEGLELCTRPYTLIADSDDTFHPNTLAELKTIWQSIEHTENPNTIAAVWTLVEDEQGRLVGEPFPKNLWQVGFKERVLKRKAPIKGEKWHSWRTSILREYKMYVHPKSFISEAATWNRINEDYDFLCVNTVHRRYWFSEDGLIHQKKPYKEIQKVNYYTAYYHLIKSNFKEILYTSHYRGVAFNYTRSSLYYRDNQLKLRGNRLLAAWLAFLSFLPGKLLSKIF